MVTWEVFYNKLKKKVTDKITDEEIFVGEIQFDKMAGEVLKEILLAQGDIKIKEVGRDEARGEPGKMVFYRDDTKQQIRRVKRRW